MRGVRKEVRDRAIALLETRMVRAGDGPDRIEAEDHRGLVLSRYTMKTTIN